MTKYIDREALIEWLKRIPLKDLSGGLGLCRVICEDDFKKAIKNMPKGIIVDAVEVVRCKDCIYSYEQFGFIHCTFGPYGDCSVPSQFYCAEGKRKRAPRGVE